VDTSHLIRDPMEITKTKLCRHQGFIPACATLGIVSLLFIFASIYIWKWEGQLEENHSLSDLYGKIRGEISKAVVGKGDIELTLMLAIIAGGHVLIEGLPALLKLSLRKLSRRQSAAISREFSLPPIWCRLILPAFIFILLMALPGSSKADILPYCSRRWTESDNSPYAVCAVEAMQENQVTIEGKKLSLGNTFMVLLPRCLPGRGDLCIDRCAVGSFFTHGKKWIFF